MDLCWCGGHFVDTATAGVYRCTGCGEIINDWDDEEDEDASEE